MKHPKCINHECLAEYGDMYGFSVGYRNLVKLEFEPTTYDLLLAMRRFPK